jgi:hypothetical protein
VAIARPIATTGGRSERRDGSIGKPPEGARG